MSTRRHTKRTSRRSEAAAPEAAAPQAEARPQTSRSSRRSKAAPEEGAGRRSSARMKTSAAEESGSGRRSSARMKSEASDRRPSARHDKNASRQATGNSREDKNAARKKKQMLINIAVVVGILLLGLIIWQSLPNPNLPIADAQLKKAEALLVQFEKEVEAKSPAGAEAIAKEIEAIIAQPIFAMGTNDPQFYTDPAFADIYYATEAKNVLDAVRKGMDEVPDIANELLVKRNCDWLATRIATIAEEEDLEALQQSIADFRRNPIDLQGDPDPVASTKYSRYIETINGKNKIVADEVARRKKLSDEERAAEEAARAKLEAERKAKEAEDRKAKIEASREKANAEREAVNNPDGEPDLPKGKDYAKMSNPQIMAEVKALAKELKFVQARKVMTKLREEDGFDMAASTEALNKEIDILFGNARQEMSESFNDARQLQRAEMVADARTSIDRAVKRLDALLAGCTDEAIKKELEELKPLYDRMYNKLWN